MEITMKQAQLRVVARALGIMLLASAATATAADKPREGLWRYTMKMDMGNIATPSISQADLARLPPEIRATIPQFNGQQMSMEYEHRLTEQDRSAYSSVGKECVCTGSSR